MDDTSVVTLLTTPLEPSFAIILILVGCYSLLINVKHETKYNHIRSTKFARIAGWCYIIGGVGILIMQ